MPSFRHFPLALLNPGFDSPLIDVLTELQHLRRLDLAMTTPAPMFFQLKHVFHMLESLGSARIEGNHTTLADYVESSLDKVSSPSDHIAEVLNIEKAMVYIEESVTPDAPISEHFIRELHALTVLDLKREGDDRPGAYRIKPAQIAQSEHLPPEAMQVAQYMHELVQFLNNNDSAKYDLIKVALAHHRFGWIHPFGNGNGRVVRLLTYALLIKYGFRVNNGAAGSRVLNPTAVFCNDRDRYYTMLASADTGTPENLERWCIYVLEGVLVELKKLDQLTRYDYLKSKILLPALAYSRSRQFITTQEEALLTQSVHCGIAKAADLNIVMPGLTEAQRTYQIKKLVERKMLRPIEVNARQYTLGFVNNVLLRGVIHALTQENFISPTLQG